MEKPTPLPARKLPLKQKVEAILFSVGRRISLQDITRLARSREDEVLEALRQLRQEYGQKDTSLFLIEDGNYWKLAVRDHYLPVVKKIVTETELSKTVLETLAIIAFKYPIKQSDLIKLRTNKAYDHLRELEQQGFISRKKHGRTNLIKLTEKFFQYFDLPEEKLREHLADFESIAAAIIRNEAESHERRQQQEKELEQLKSQDDRIKKEIAGLDSSPEGAAQSFVTPQKVGPLEVYEEQPPQENKIGPPLEVYDAGQEQQSPPGESQELPQEGTAGQQDDGNAGSASEPQSGIVSTPEMEEEISRKVEGMLAPHHAPKEQKPTEDGGDEEDKPRNLPGAAKKNPEDNPE